MLRRHEQIAFAGSTHFITLVKRVRGEWFVTDEICRRILESFEFCRAKVRVNCGGYVLMPDHLHAILRQQAAGNAVAALVRDFKKFTSRRLRPAHFPGETLWRIRYDDVPVPGRDAVQTKIVYIHENPVRRGLAATPEAYRWSSACAIAGEDSSIVELTAF